MTIVKLLVDNGAQILKPKGDGMNVLHVAASSNDIHLLDYAIKENYWLIKIWLFQFINIVLLRQALNEESWIYHFIEHVSSYAYIGSLKEIYNGIARYPKMKSLANLSIPNVNDTNCPKV